ncbi:MAG: hypothetical protein KAS82_10845, partial [Bacteroidales bacterium]|nr:hypothetical protein [Bacteroidales bacterium]
MKRFKSLLLKLPEFLLIAVVLAYWVSAGSLLNPIAIGLVGILIFQIIKRNQEVGLSFFITSMIASGLMIFDILHHLKEMDSIGFYEATGS